MFGFEEHADYHYDSDAELDRQEAYERGEANPDNAWILTNRGAWHANPFYKGPFVEHPEIADMEAWEE